MESEKLKKWSELLLDTGRRNNLINFRDRQKSTVEIIAPGSAQLFEKVQSSGRFEVFDPDLEDAGDIDLFDREAADAPKHSKQEYLAAYAPKMKRNQVLLHNVANKPIAALKHIAREARTALEETGANIAYLAIGFVGWSEPENGQAEMRAPLLLAPIAIENESAVDPHFVSVLDDDIVVNPTFAFKLQNEYGIRLPEYDEDAGIDAYLDAAAQTVARLKWTVSKECKIAIFSFLKLNMYKDLIENEAAILRNPNVRLLLGERIQPSEPRREGAGDGADLLDLRNVVDADSSQSEAIRAAKLNQSFVLQGPPGTGKSQTITNIVAECLYDGKKVLFVSEKLAALNVVHDKLKKAGLAEFCLELHSHKANKNSIIQELHKTLMAPKSAVSDKAGRELLARKQSQDKLDGYAKELHEIRPVINKSVYQLFEEISACGNEPAIDFVIDGIRSKGEEHLLQAENYLGQYANYAQTIGPDYRDNTWNGYANLNGSYQEGVQLKARLHAFARLPQALLQINPAVAQSCRLAASSIKEARALRDVFGVMETSEYVTPAVFAPRAVGEMVRRIDSLKELAAGITKIRSALGERFDQTVYELPAETILPRLKEEFARPSSRIFSKEYKRIAKDIRDKTVDGKKPGYEQAVALAENLVEHARLVSEFEGQQTVFKETLGPGYRGVYTDFEKLREELGVLESCLKACRRLAALSELPAAYLESQKGNFGIFAARYAQALAEFAPDLEAILAEFDAAEYDIVSAPLDELVAKANACASSTDMLDHWRDFYRFLRSVSSFGLRAYLDFAIQSRFSPERIGAVYKKAFYTQWADALLRELPELTDLSRVSHDEAISRFKEKDRLNFEISKAEIKARLSARRPNLSMIVPGSPAAVLLRENQKKRKKKPIRQLFADLGGLALTLKPCFLMSPLSVSTYLGPSFSTRRRKSFPRTRSARFTAPSSSSSSATPSKCRQATSSRRRSTLPTTARPRTSRTSNRSSTSARRSCPNAG